MKDENKTKEQLKQELVAARAIIDSIPLGMHMYRLEPDDRLVFAGANATADKLLGVDNSIFVGKTIEEAFPPLVETEVPARYRAAAGQGEAWQTKQVTYDKDEIQGAFEVYAFQTTPGNMVAAFLDATERTRQELELKRLANLIESSADFISLATPEGQGLYINVAGLEMIGYTQEEFDAGMNIAEVQPNLSPEVFQIAATEGMWKGEGTLIHKNGQEIAISQTITSHKDNAGNIQGFSTIIRDITEVKQNEAERERLQQEIIDAQQRAIAELSTPVIPIMDRVIVMPMVGSIDSMRARDITRALLAGIGHHRAKVVILDVTGVSLMDTGIVNHLNKTIQAARLKGAQTIVTGISDAVAESIVDLGIDWSAITTLSDLQTGLLVALESLNYELNKKA